MEMKGYDKLTKAQQKKFDKVLRICLLTQSSESLKTMEIKSVEPQGTQFLINFVKDGTEGQLTLDPHTLSWG